MAADLVASRIRAMHLPPFDPNEMKVHAGMPLQPTLDRRAFVRAEIVEDNVNRVTLGVAFSR